MAETRNIVIIGASFAGLSSAHYFLKHTYPKLKSSQPDTTYRVVLIDRSSHFYWRVGAPRASVSTKLISHEQSFTPIPDGFKDYPPGSFEFRHATVTSVDTAARTVGVAAASPGDEKPASIPYHSLIIASGCDTPTALTGLVGDYTESRDALDAMNARLARATDVVIGGGGPVGVETAGEIGEALNGVAGWFAARPAAPKARVTLVTGSAKLLPALRQSLSDKAARFLNRVGVDVVYKTRVDRVDSPAGDDPAAKSTVHLSDGRTLPADVYIPATGTKPNTSFLPAALVAPDGRVATDAHLRVPAAAPRVYAVGDAGNHSRGGVMEVYAGVPVLLANVAADLGVPRAAEAAFKRDDSETQIVPVGRGKGVGALKGVPLPSLAVWGIKGRDYMLQFRPGITHGTKW